MTKKPQREIEISVVLNGHREGQLIHPTLISMQRVVKFARDCGIEVELIVVLDRSDADTMSIVTRDLTEQDRTLHVDFGDLALARNHGVEQARGTHVAFMDGDDLCCRSWLVDCLLMARADPRRLALHPEFSIYFGDDDAHVLHHVDSESDRFEAEHFLKQNYWTALAFSARQTFRDLPYRRLELARGFGYEDWVWNHESMLDGVVHKTVPMTAHYIRRGKREQSLLDRTNSTKTVPRLLDIYRQRPLAA